MTDAELCKALWIEPIMVCCNSPTAHMLNNGYRCIGDSCAQMDDGGCQYKKLVYPTGDALTKALKAALVELEMTDGIESFETGYSGGEWSAFIHHPDNKAKFGQGVSQEFADTELDAIKAACKAMCEVKKQ